MSYLSYPEFLANQIEIDVTDLKFRITYLVGSYQAFVINQKSIIEHPMLQTKKRVFEDFSSFHLSYWEIEDDKAINLDQFNHLYESLSFHTFIPLLQEEFHFLPDTDTSEIFRSRLSELFNGFMLKCRKEIINTLLLLFDLHVAFPELNDNHLGISDELKLLEDKLLYVWESICLKRELEIKFERWGSSRLNPSDEPFFTEIFDFYHEDGNDLVNIEEDEDSSIFFQNLFEICHNIYNKRLLILKEYVQSISDQFA